MTRAERASVADAGEVAAFVARLNSIPEHRIGYFGDTPEEIANELISWGTIERALVARDRGGDIVAFMGIEVDDVMGRSYLNGPLAESSRWPDLPLRLVAECLALVPEAAARLLELFFDVENTNLAGLGRSLGFESYKDVRLMRFDRSQLASLAPGTASKLDPEHHEQLAVLHDRLFPNTHLPGARMVAGLGAHKACFVKISGGEVEGYVYLEVQEETGAAGVEYLGTAEGARRRGVGEDLVRAGTHWMLSFDNVSQAWLTVDEDNAVAQRLYHRLGWSFVRRLTSMRRRGKPTPLVGGPAEPTPL
ncbi:MAG: GNAT family N-acetyltransferase [Actinomycetota bacterium]